MALPTDDSLEEKKIQAKTCLCEKTLCSMLPPTNWIAVWLLGFVTPWTVACQAPLSMGFSRQIYWSGLPFPSPGDHPDPETEPKSPASHADSFALSHQGSPLTGYKNRKSEPKSSKILPFSQHGEVG